MTRSGRKAILKTLAPEALDDPLIKGVLDHERRMSTDPVIRARRAQVDAECQRETRPWRIASGIFGMAINTALWSGVYYFRLAPIGLAVGGFAVISALVYTATRRW